MRLALIFAVAIAATIHTSANALPSPATPNAAIEKEALSAIVGLPEAEGGRLLRRVEKDQDDSDEERGFSFGDLLKKLSPVPAAEKSRKSRKNKGNAEERRQPPEVASI
ncbi:hypothetical protein ON010_g5472 [Phytophthora cinnamomi]|nr:hypothetical protein ON010_g5472 [Phytophthora cinnamomi]